MRYRTVSCRCQQAATPEQVGGAAAQQQKPTVGQQVAADYPLQALLRESNVLPDRRQRDVGDRRVDEVEEAGQAHRRKGQLAPAGRRGTMCGLFTRSCEPPGSAAQAALIPKTNGRKPE
jgi:hypothetical protein